MMDNSLLIISVCLAVMVVIDMYTIYKGWRAKKLKYAVKKVVNQTSPLIFMIFLIYGMLFVIFVFSLVVDSAMFENPSWAIAIAPAIWVIIFFVFWMGYLARFWKPLMKYTDEEITWRREEIERSRNTMPRYLKWLYRQSQKDDSIL